MINPTREQVATALFALLSAIPGITFASRRPALWSNAVAMPALYMGNPMEQYVYEHGTALPPTVTLEFDCFLYINSGLDPNVNPDTEMNTLLDAIDLALAAIPNGPPQSVQDLNGIVNHAWIEGTVNRAPGYLNGEGMAFFSIKALVPQ